MMLGTIAVLARDSFDTFDHGRFARRIASLTLPGAVAVALGASFGFWILHERADVAPEVAQTTVAPKGPKLVLNPYGTLVDPGFSKSEPASLAGNFAPRASLEPPPVPSALPAASKPAESDTQFGAIVPLPPPRPRELAAQVADAAPKPPSRPVDRSPAAPAAPAEDRTFLQKLLALAHPLLPSTASSPPSGGVSVSPRQQAAAAPSEPTQVASVAGDPRQQPGFAGDPRQSGVLGVLKSAIASPTSRYDQFTAVYDLSAHVVYLPNGARLEAHSGLGDRLDDPRHVSERMRGATPPHMYELTMREGSFHGVQALRLNPVGEGGIYGRAGLLAHPFMLGPNGDSNGCVSIKEYDAFLQAYQRGQVKRLAVVASVN